MRDAIHHVRKHRQISRAQLSTVIGLNPSSITEMVRELLKIGLLRAEEWVSTPGRGRPQQMLKMGQKNFYSIGIAINFEVNLVLLNPAFEIVDHRQIPNEFRDSNSSFEKGIKNVILTIKKMMKAISTETLVSIGVSISGNVFADHTDLFSANDFSNISQAQEFLKTLRTEIGCPVKVINDSHVSVLAERWVNPEFPLNPTLIYITPRLGVGFILEGHLYEGPAKWTRALSHYKVERDRGVCYCGEVGCLTTMATPDVISERLAGRTWNDPVRSVAARNKDVDTLWKRYEKGDPEVIEKVHQGLEDLSLALRNITTLFSFDAIIWEPWNMRFSADLVRRLEIASAKWIQQIPSKKIHIPSLGAHQQAVGAGIFAMEDFFDSLLKPE